MAVTDEVQINAKTLKELNDGVEHFFEEMRSRFEAHAAHVLFRLERMEQALLTFAGEAAAQPTVAASELGRILRLSQAEFNDRNLAPPTDPLT